MRTLSIFWKDLQLFVRDPGAIIQVFILPIVFLSVFIGLAANAFSGQEEERLIDLPVQNLDNNSTASQELLSALDQAGGLKTRLADPALTTDEKITLLLTIPQGYEDALKTETPVNLDLFSQEPSSNDTQSVLLIVNGVTRMLSMNTRILASLRQMGEMNAAGPAEVQVFTSDRLVQQAQTQMQESEKRPLVAIQATVPSALEAVKDQLNPVQLAVPGLTVLFAFLAAQVTASSFYDEKKIGSFRRLLAAPLNKSQILAGKLLPNLLLVLVQIAVMFAFGVFFLPLMGFDPINISQNPLGLILITFFTALCSTSLGIFIAAIARTQAQISGGAQVILWVSGLVSGALVPLYLLNNQMLNTLSKFFPQTYSVQGFTDILVRGYSVEQILPELGMLIVFSLLFFLVGILRFKFE